MEPTKFLFICTGNTCRSLMAQKLLEKAASAAGLAWQVRSCGVAAEPFFKVPPAVKKALSAHGVGDFEHTPKLVSRDLLGWADAALVMAEEHKDEVVDRFPEFSAKVHLFRPYAGSPEPASVEDPIGQPDEVYAVCCAQLLDGVAALIKKHGQNRQPLGKTGS